MITIKYRSEYANDLSNLYTEAGWGDFQGKEHILQQRFENSTFAAYYIRDEKVVGCIRALSDRVSVTWIAEILVAKACQRQGIGRELVALVLEEFKDTDVYLETFDSAAEFFVKCGLKARTSMVVCSKKHD